MSLQNCSPPLPTNLLFVGGGGGVSVSVCGVSLCLVLSATIGNALCIVWGGSVQGSQTQSV